MFLAFASSAFRVRAAYRAQVWAMLFGIGLDVFARISIWSAVFGGAAVVDGISLSQMLTYAVLAVALLGAFDSTQLVRDIGAAIRSGDVAVQLLKPYGYPLALMAQQLGGRLFEFVVVGLPIIIVTMLTVGIEPPASFAHGLLFAFYILVSVGLVLAIGIVFGLLSFWVLDAHALEWFMRGLMVILSGGFVPLWFFPAGLGQVAAVLPFSWITYHPLATYLGRVDLATSFGLLAAGFAWLGATLLFIWWLWSKTTTRLIVQGG